MAITDFPWFKVYAAETLSDENFASWSPSERGIWFTLLCHCWKEGSIPNDTDRLSRLCGCSAQEMLEHWPSIKDRFRESEGRLFSTRLEFERAISIAEAEKKTDKARKGANAKWAKYKESMLKSCPSNAQAEPKHGPSNAKESPKQSPSIPQAMPDPCSALPHSHNQRIKEEPLPGKAEQLVGTRTPPEPAPIPEVNHPAEIDEPWSPVDEENVEVAHDWDPMAIDLLETALTPFSKGEQQMLLKGEATFNDMKILGELKKMVGGEIISVERENP